jgi:pimeloyl-ACP methyl ester carboxylesterase
VLVHGAFADGSSWNKIVPMLESKGFNVFAIQNPLSSLSDDVAATKRVLDAVTGPVVLVGHSWGGTVITQAGVHDKVKASVYVAAFAPNEGQSSVDTGKDFPTPPGIGKLAPYADGFVYLPADAVAQDFAPDVTPAEKKLIAATQGPIRGKNFEEKVSAAAWKTKPSFYIVATADRMIDPGQQRAMAKQINATTTEVKSGHVPMVSAPKSVAEVITTAARKVATTK